MTLKKRVLFVDDEPNILSGLRRMLWGMNDQWDMAFASSGAEALSILASAPHDVVVTDMRMPGMDGAELLAEIIKKYPHIIRIVLSGQSEMEAILKSVGPTHQYLSKPCDAETIKQVITRACYMRDALASDSLKNVVTQLKALPSLPALYLNIMDCLKTPDCSLNKIGEIVSSDISMSAKILQLVNSAFFGQPRRVSDVGFAVSLLGIDTIRALVLSTQVFTQFEARKLENLKLGGLWSHSLIIGTVARDIAKSESKDKKLVDDTFMAGLLHDIGKLVIANNMPDQYREIQAISLKERISLDDAEFKVLGASHAEIGGYLLGLWGLPDPIVEAVFFNHSPGCSAVKQFSPLVAVHAADCFCLNTMADESEPNGPASCLDFNYIKEIGMEEKLPAWEQIYRRAMEKAALNE
ncbi:MAG: HDOD domain-containing protein [Nitrospinae bacterium]|nr:HDOD domain-containing protein [Nitrospinota bacterium]